MQTWRPRENLVLTKKEMLNIFKLLAKIEFWGQDISWVGFIFFWNSSTEIFLLNHSLEIVNIVYENKACLTGVFR